MFLTVIANVYLYLSILEFWVVEVYFVSLNSQWFGIHINQKIGYKKDDMQLSITFIFAIQQEGVPWRRKKLIFEKAWANITNIMLIYINLRNMWFQSSSWHKQWAFSDFLLEFHRVYYVLLSPLLSVYCLCTVIYNVR